MSWPEAMAMNFSEMDRCFQRAVAFREKAQSNKLRGR